MRPEDLIIRTERLELIAATLELLETEIHHPGRLGLLLGAEVSPGWPPGEYDRAALAYFRDRHLAQGKDACGWYNWYALLPASGPVSAALVGSAGYFGPPDADGLLEIGYSVLPVYRGRGYAGEMARALVDRALAVPTVRRIIAHTHVGNLPSISVLRRCQLTPAGSGPDPGTLRFERRIERSGRGSLP